MRQMGYAGANRVDSFQFNFEDIPKQSNKTNKCLLTREFLVTPERLEVLAAIALDKLKIPPSILWTVQDVKDFIRKLGFSTYPNVFADNMINGRSLLIVDASALSKMNIQNFDDIKTLTKVIRNLYEIDEAHFTRSVALPPRYPLTHWKFYVRCSGAKASFCRPSDLLIGMKLFNDPCKMADANHWDKLENWLKHEPKEDVVKIGYAPRYNLYQGERPYLRKICPNDKLVKVKCECIPPCECLWTNRELRKPWTLSCLS